MRDLFWLVWTTAIFLGDKYGQIMSSPHLGEFIVKNMCPIPLDNIEHTLNVS